MGGEPWIAFFDFRSLLAGASAPAPAGRSATTGSATTGNGADGPVAGQPVAVMRRGVVWDADRAARARGVFPGTATVAARTLCPEIVRRAFDPAVDGPRLRLAWTLLAEASSTVEPDPEGRPQAYAAWPGGAPPLPELRSLQDAVHVRLPAVELSAGLGGSRLVARLACPDAPGVVRVDRGGEAAFLAPRPLGELVAEGLLAPALRSRLQAIGLERCGQVAALPEHALRARFGREGGRLYGLCHGGDARPVRALYPPRILAARHGFPEGLPAEGWPAMATDLTRQAAAGLAPDEGAGRLTLWVGTGRHVRTWKAPCADRGTLTRTAAALAAKAARSARRPAARMEVLLGDISVVPPRAIDLFTGRAEPARQALDELIERLPAGTLRRGRGPTDRHGALIAMLDPWNPDR